MVFDPVNKSNYVSLHCIFPQLFVRYNKINNDLVAGDSAFLSILDKTLLTEAIASVNSVSSG